MGPGLPTHPYDNVEGSDNDPEAGEGRRPRVQPAHHRQGPRALLSLVAQVALVSLVFLTSLVFL